MRVSFFERSQIVTKGLLLRLEALWGKSEDTVFISIEFLWLLSTNSFKILLFLIEVYLDGDLFVIVLGDASRVAFSHYTVSFSRELLFLSLLASTWWGKLTLHFPHRRSTASKRVSFFLKIFSVFDLLFVRNSHVGERLSKVCFKRSLLQDFWLLRNLLVSNWDGAWSLIIWKSFWTNSIRKWLVEDLYWVKSWKEIVMFTVYKLKSMNSIKALNFKFQNGFYSKFKAYFFPMLQIILI